MPVKEKAVHSTIRLGTEDRAFLCVAMNAGSPTGLFRDSAGYAMLLQRTYAAQNATAKKMDEQLPDNEKPEE